MNDEIKEILEQLEIVVNKPLPMLILAPEYTKILLDYITNLQQENDYYFKKNNELSTLNTSLRNARDDFKSRIYKAVEIIDLMKPELWNISNKMTYKLINIKNILQNGSDDNG